MIDAIIYQEGNPDLKRRRVDSQKMDLEEIFEDFISASSHSAADAADATATATANNVKSNDNEELVGIPRDQLFDNGDTTGDSSTSTSTSSLGALLDLIEEEAGAFEARDDGSNTVSPVNGNNDGDDSQDGPCSNDNPAWDKETQPCPGATYEGIFGDLITTAAPIVSSELGGDNSDGIVDVVDATGSESLGDGEGNDADGDILDGGAGTDAVIDASPTRQPIALSSAWDAPGNAPDDSGDSDTTITYGEDTPAEETVIPEEEDVVTNNDIIDVVGSYPTFYSCSAESQEELDREGAGNEELPLRFNYEIYTSTSAANDVTDILATFERQLANGVASSLGLVDCTDDSSSGGDGSAVEIAVRSGGDAFGGRRRSLQAGYSRGKNRMLGSANDVVGVSMDPTDVEDTEMDACTSSSTTDTLSKCSPIIGAMTATITQGQQRRLQQLADSDSKEEQEAMLYNLVETYIEQNENSYLNDELLQVSYIGQRSNAIVGDNTIIIDAAESDQIDRGTTTVPINSGGEDAGPSVVLISLAAVAVVIAMAVLGAAVAYRRRQRRNQEANSFDLDVETGAFPALTPESESNRFNRTLDDEDDNDEEEDIFSPLRQDSNVPSSNLFGLQDVAASDAAVESMQGNIMPPSSLAALGMSSSIASRQISYSQPPGSLPQDEETQYEESSYQQDTSDITNSQDVLDDDMPPMLDLAPTMREAIDDDILPMSPANAGDDTSDLSTTFDDVEEGEGEDPDDAALVPPVSPSVTNVLTDVAPDVGDEASSSDPWTAPSPSDDDVDYSEEGSSGVMA